MRIFEVIPHVGVAPVRLGMSRDDVRRAMPDQPHCFRKSAGIGQETDAYHNNGFQVFYSGDPPIVEYIELSRGCSFHAIYRGLNVFDTDADEVVRFVSLFTPFDRDRPEQGYSYIFPELEMSLWRPTVPESAEDPEDRQFSTIGIGVNGYYSGRSA